MEINLVVRQAEIKSTKTNKPYLSLVLTDGKHDIGANIWDWYQDSCPPKNTILYLQGEVGEFNSNLQLTIKYFKVNNELSLIQFIPAEDFDINAYVQNAIQLANSIQNEQIKSIVTDIFNRYEDLWRIQPGAKKVHHAVVAGNLKHSVDVALKVRAMLPLIPDCNGDLAIAGALIHDLGKLWSYYFDGICIEFSQEGYTLEHHVLGIRELEKFRNSYNGTIVDLLQHMIASHHGRLEYGSPMTPKCMEAWLVYYCDELDAKAQIIKELNESTKPEAQYTPKCYALENKYMLSRNIVENMMRGVLDEV